MIVCKVGAFHYLFILPNKKLSTKSGAPSNSSLCGNGWKVDPGKQDVGPHSPRRVLSQTKPYISSILSWMPACLPPSLHPCPVSISQILAQASQQPGGPDTVPVVPQCPHVHVDGGGVRTRCALEKSSRDPIFWSVHSGASHRTAPGVGPGPGAAVPPLGSLMPPPHLSCSQRGAQAHTPSPSSPTFLPPRPPACRDTRIG